MSKGDFPIIGSDELPPSPEFLPADTGCQAAVTDLWPSSRSLQVLRQSAGAVERWDEPARASFFGGQPAPMAGW